MQKQTAMERRYTSMVHMVPAGNNMMTNNNAPILQRGIRMFPIPMLIVICFLDVGDDDDDVGGDVEPGCGGGVTN